MPANSPKTQAKAKGHKDEDLDGELNEWKFRAPYLVHKNIAIQSDEDGDDKGKGEVSGEEGSGKKRKRGGGEGFRRVYYDASCHCGKVKYQLLRDKPLASKICHCSTCQVLHGSMFQLASVFNKEDINFLKGHHDLAWYESEEKTTKHKLPCKVSCSYCRTPIMDEGRNMILLFPSLIKFKSQEEKKKFEPQCHMFYGNRLINIPDGKPKWAGLNDKSDLLDED